MPGRKQPRPTEEERTREYRLLQKRGRGEHIVGDEAADLGEAGDAARIERERQEWAEERAAKKRS
jgi:hypothetical protein